MFRRPPIDKRGVKKVYYFYFFFNCKMYYSISYNNYTRILVSIQLHFQLRYRDRCNRKESVNIVETLCDIGKVVSEKYEFVLRF